MINHVQIVIKKNVEDETTAIAPIVAIIKDCNGTMWQLPYLNILFVDEDGSSIFDWDDPPTACLIRLGNDPLIFRLNDGVAEIDLHEGTDFTVSAPTGVPMPWVSRENRESK